jgi:uncharacterized protein YyaL (SSP411 family)
MITRIFFIVFLILNTLYAQNKLSSETSPYLLQHKNNPVHWYPWSDEAFEIAKKQNKLIFLSIGYSTCHWCHVMAHESFEDEKIAKILNDKYISIKVDKEQFPHIDKYYQGVYRFLNQKSGGWPLSMFLTADKKAFYAQTYIPKEEGYGSIGIKNILNKIASTPRSVIHKASNDIHNIMQSTQNVNKQIVKVNSKLALQAINDIKNSFDFENNGFSKGTKFPQANKIKLLLKLYEMTKNKDALSIAQLALDTMATKGIYDQIHGGFYRYTVDSAWHIPHFEKMLYTNAELIEVYTLAYKITRKPLYKKIVEQTIQEIDNRFKQNNLYLSASNADSKNEHGHNEEGAYFVFNFDDTLEYLLENNIQENIAIKHLNYLGITSEGNFETDLSIPYITSKKKIIDIKQTIELLKKYRDKKEYPFIDNKINTAWNALYLKAKIQASFIHKRYLNEALYSLDQLMATMYKNKTLFHQTIKGIAPTQEALLEDYAFLSNTLFYAYNKTLNKKYFLLFEELTTNSIQLFYKNIKWRESTDSFKTYANLDSNAYANPLAIHLINIINYASLKANTKIYKVAKDTLDKFSYNINTYPSYYPMATLAILMQKYEPVFIKSTKQNLTQINLDKIQYPFIYQYEDSSDLYLACKINTCFSFGKDFKKIKKDIENLF